MRTFIVAVLTGILASVAWAQAPQTAPRGMKIGFVDLTRALEKYERRVVLEKELQELHDTLSRQDDVSTKELRRVTDEMEQLAMGSPERVEMEGRRRKLAADLETFRRTSMEKLNKRYVDMILQLYTRIVQETDAVARERDYDMVIKDQTMEPEVGRRGEVVLQMSQRVVLFSKPEYDLTNSVIERLNAAFQAEQKKTGGAPAPAPEKKP